MALTSSTFLVGGFEDFFSFSGDFLTSGYSRCILLAFSVFFLFSVGEAEPLLQSDAGDGIKLCEWSGQTDR